MGYPSTLARLASEQQAGRLRIAPRSVTSSSETLGVEDRARITAGFGVPVVNQFGSTEGLLGHSEPGDDVLTFASDLCIAELVDDDHRPVPDGTPSTKVLVTNLHNLTQPLIRYELTDSFIRRPDGENPGLLRATVAGRVDDALRFGRVEVHPHVLRSELVKSPTISEYQVRQTPSGVDVDVITDGPIDPDAIAASLEQVLRAAGLDNPKAEVRKVDALTRHTQTGKTRRFIPYDESSTVTP
jgi:phenylacetate-coenzyme A ligase PaaK-like adenylate-forming protein